MAGEGPEYLEFNFSPSGEWAVYAFCGYRERSGREIATWPGISVYRSDELLELDVEVNRDALPAGRPLRIGLSAVVQEAEGVLSYWALCHPAEKPDFHHSGSFVLEI